MEIAHVHGLMDDGLSLGPGDTSDMMDVDKEQIVTAVVANSKGEIFELDGYGAVGMAGADLSVLACEETIPMPHGSELMLLPDRLPVLFNLATGRYETVSVNPFEPDEPIFPVAVFNSPAYVNTYAGAYEERPGAELLPLFAYGAVGWHGEGFRSAALRVDQERRQDLRLMSPDKVDQGVDTLKKRLPGNRLRRHLEHCAIVYGCPAAKNFFIGRCEAPLPTAQQCNARCLGCISLQKNDRVRSPQDRIDFTPTPEEIAEIALTHIRRVDRCVVSFGQGCEGDPLLAANVIGPAIRLIREETDHGTINMNTNGSRPEVLDQLLEAGLDSVRFSINSVRQKGYETYCRPVGYGFSDLETSIDFTLRRGKFVSINYLNCPGVSDAPEEADALVRFVDRHPINLIQWRNLNFDPLRYWQVMNAAQSLGPPRGMKTVIESLGALYPHVRAGYFNPPKEVFARTRESVDGFTDSN
jgi:pyruvate-formate lyase-activating enzyme